MVTNKGDKAEVIVDHTCKYNYVADLESLLPQDLPKEAHLTKIKWKKKKENYLLWFLEYWVTRVIRESKKAWMLQQIRPPHATRVRNYYY